MLWLPWPPPCLIHIPWPTSQIHPCCLNASKLQPSVGTLLCYVIVQFKGDQKLAILALVTFIQLSECIMSVNGLVVHFHLNNCPAIIYRENKPWLSCITAVLSLNSPFLFKSASAHFFSEWCHKYKQNVKIAGQAAASQITVININLFPTSRLSYSFCIIKLSSGRNIEMGRKGVEGIKGKGKGR